MLNVVKTMLKDVKGFEVCFIQKCQRLAKAYEMIEKPISKEVLGMGLVWAYWLWWGVGRVLGRGLEERELLYRMVKK